MKKKLTEKKGHVVAWIDKAEWDQVLEYLYSKECTLQKYALHRISAWKGRFSHNTPIAVESTADLVRCQILDRSGQLEADDLVLLYGTALVRFVNLITERQQGKIARPLRRLANKLRIPEWIVNLRHDITHRKLPTLKWCRKGCKFVLEWLQQEYWSRQLGSGLTENWDSQSEGEDGEEEQQRQEDQLIARQKEIESYKKARELLISFEKEQFQAFEGFLVENKPMSLLPAPSADMSWILAQIKLFALESSEILIDVLMEDGFIVPTIEQLESLGVNTSDNVDPTAPGLPRVVLRFWLPLLKDLNSQLFIQLLLEKLFVELQQPSEDDQKHRMFYVAGWISEVILCNANKSEYHYESKSQRKARQKDNIFINRIQLRWQQLLAACLNAPCVATPHLLQQILEYMDHPMPLDTQQKLLKLSSIYTQSADSGCDPSIQHSGQHSGVYTLESLHEKLKSRCPGHTLRQGTVSDQCKALPERTEDFQEHLSPDVLAERAAELRGSPWQVCTDKVEWRNYPLGKVPGQLKDPTCLMLDHFSTMTVFDQQVEMENATQHNAHAGVSMPHRITTDGLLWTHNDISKLKAGLQLF
ncbi:ribosomal biogenesis protein LAS1L [Esox lucius]|uniref:LAS1 like ribosome biogenesis factor n=1 Tax=Esox lucius TaxID=8010 RepID=A0A3P8Y0K2_ESOLU|nr:ribosomal biogenesis protein LAS1L [Esox lucius]